MKCFTVLFLIFRLDLRIITIVEEGVEATRREVSGWEALQEVVRRMGRGAARVQMTRRRPGRRVQLEDLVPFMRRKRV
jgi:hypothetical protein